MREYYKTPIVDLDSTKFYDVLNKVSSIVFASNPSNEQFQNFAYLVKNNSFINFLSIVGGTSYIVAETTIIEYFDKVLNYNEIPDPNNARILRVFDTYFSDVYSNINLIRDYLHK